MSKVLLEEFLQEELLNTSPKILYFNEYFRIFPIFYSSQYHADDILNMVPQYVLIANAVRAKNRCGEIINSFMTEVPII